MAAQNYFNKSIEELNIASNVISDSEAQYLFVSLVGNYTIVVIVLFFLRLINCSREP